MIVLGFEGDLCLIIILEIIFYDLFMILLSFGIVWSSRFEI